MVAVSHRGRMVVSCELSRRVGVRCGIGDWRWSWRSLAGNAGAKAKAIKLLGKKEPRGALVYCLIARCIVPLRPF